MAGVRKLWRRRAGVRELWKRRAGVRESRGRGPDRTEAGAASVEHVGLVLLVALVFLASLAALASAPAGESARELGVALERHIRCPAALPGPCWRDPLTAAYGRALAGALRALAPAPEALPAADGSPLVPVDFRTCRSESCALAGPVATHLTASGRRVTLFAAARPDADGATLTYWSYRPTLGWTRTTRRVDRERIAALASTPLLETADPRLVPLETLAGRDHYDFPEGEEPPWRWSVPSRYPG